MSHIQTMGARDMMSKGLTGPLFSPNPKKKDKSWSQYLGLSKKSSTQKKKVTPNEEYDNNDDISPRDSDLGLDLQKPYNVTTSLHDMKALPLFFEDEIVYFLNDGQYVKGRIISQNEDNLKYIIQPVNSSMSTVEIDENNITTIDNFKRKGGKTFKRNRKNNKRKTRRNKNHAKPNKKYFKKGKKQSKRIKN